jgi:hypothetical protein
MNEWQPIETAPKDGTDIIVGYDFASVWIVHVAFWRGVDLDMGFTEDDVGWWSYKTTSVAQEQLGGYYAPTHWIPLPKVPV